MKKFILTTEDENGNKKELSQVNNVKNGSNLTEIDVKKYEQNLSIYHSLYNLTYSLHPFFDVIKVTFEDIVEFHYRFETIHPFQDGNGRIGRLIAFKQCLEQNLIPFYIDDANKWLYYRGLREWTSDKNYLIETCRFGQDQYKSLLKYFGVTC